MHYPGYIAGHPRPSAKPVSRPERAQQARPWTLKRKVKTALAVTFIIAATAAAITAIAFSVLIARVRATLPSVAKIATYRPSEGTTIWSSDGVLLAKLQMENRKVVPLEKISKRLQDATLAVEDHRFYQHNGVDYRGIGRAVWTNVARRDATSQGASTITQQLARNIPTLGIGAEKTIARKVREAMTARRIEQVFSKKEILELYLNQIFYGSGAYGAEAAALTYFGKHAKDVTIAEAALLAGLPQRPADFTPYRNPEAAKARRDVVLKRMLVTKRITDAEYREALAAPIKVQPQRPRNAVHRAHYFVDWVIQDLQKHVGDEGLYSGLKVVTTLDWKMQQAAEKAVRNGLGYGATQGALIALDPHTGEVRAMVGGTDYKKDQYNVITQGKRQPGSAFKPFVYAAAMESGAISLTTAMMDEKLKIENGNKFWTVHNFGDAYRDAQITVYDAITRSVNSVAVQTAQTVGIGSVISFAQRLGINSELAPYLPLALGASAVRPIELASAYGVFAAGGTRYEPTGLRSITDYYGRKRELPGEFQRKRANLVQPGTVDQMNLGLRNVVLNGTAQNVSGVPMAFGKTGTTNDHRDAWFVGYTPELVTAVWVGRPVRSGNKLTYAVMPGATGGRAAAPIWSRFMTTAVVVQKQANKARKFPVRKIHLPPVPPMPDLTPKPAEQAVAELDGNSVMSGVPMVNGRYPAELDELKALNLEPRAETVPPVAAERLPAYRAPRERSVQKVRVCAESGERAGRWCPSTVSAPADEVVGDGACLTHLPEVNDPSE
jgi:penicillin-binding protein 1A